ncbi:MAG: hypothetical protein ABFD65_14865, partial [Candidatus Polarisedimenticolia bacterium]
TALRPKNRNAGEYHILPRGRQTGRCMVVGAAVALNGASLRTDDSLPTSVNPAPHVQRDQAGVES